MTYGTTANGHFVFFSLSLYLSHYIFPAGSKVLPADFAALTTDSETLPTGSKAHLTGSETLSALSEAFQASKLVNKLQLQLNPLFLKF